MRLEAPQKRHPSVNVRDATAADLPHIMEIERLGFAQPWSLDSFRRELILPFSRIFVATPQIPDADSRHQRSPGLPAGFLCRWLIADECHVLNVAVHPRARREGVAMTLLGEAIDEAKAKKARFVTLEVRRSNVAARSLYRKLQFEEQRLRMNYYGPGEDAIVMELPIGDRPG
jgi:ribosomal-protein-alanine N-acetyltransferase